MLSMTGVQTRRTPSTLRVRWVFLQGIVIGWIIIECRTILPFPLDTVVKGIELGFTHFLIVAFVKVGTIQPGLKFLATRPRGVFDTGWTIIVRCCLIPFLVLLLVSTICVPSRLTRTIGGGGRGRGRQSWSLFWSSTKVIWLGKKL